MNHCLYLPALLVLTLHLQGAVPAPDKLLTAETLAVFTVPDMQEARAKGAEWPMWRFLEDPAMKPLRDKFVAKLKTEYLDAAERDWGMTLTEVLALMQGQVTVGITRGTLNAKEGGMPGVMVVIDSKDKSEALQTQLNQLKKKWVESGKKIKTEKIRDVEFARIDLSDRGPAAKPDKAPGDKPAGDKPDGGTESADKSEFWFVGQSDSLLIVGNTTQDIEKVLVRQSGGAVPGLSEQGNFSSSYSSVLRDSLGYGWINLQAVVEIVTKMLAAEQGADGAGEFMGIRPDRLMGALGLQALESMGWSVKDLPQGAMVESLLAVPAAKRKGLFSVFTLEPLDANPPAFVPADAVKFSRLRLDLPKTWKSLEGLVGEAFPQMIGMLNLLLESAGKDKDKDFDVRKNLIANLGNDIISYQKLPRQQTPEGLESPPTIWLVGSPKPEQLAAAVKALATLMPNENAAPTEREFLGRKVYSLPLPSSQDSNGRPVERAIHYAASGSYVALSPDESLLEEFLRTSATPGKPLREAAGLMEAAEKVGGMSTGLFGYEDYQATMRATFEVMKKNSGTVNKILPAAPLGAVVDNNDFKEWIDLSLLPDFDKVSKYFHFNVWSAVAGAEGYRFKMYLPDSPRLK